MSNVKLFPDAEALVAEWLREQLPARVYSSIPANPTYPLITVKRIGGIPADPAALDRASIQIEVWGNSKSEARDLADAARVKLHAMENRLYRVALGDVADAWVAGVNDSLGLTWIPDPVTDRDRYLFGVNVYTQ